MRITEADFRLVSDYEPAGDQPRAIEDITRTLEGGGQDVVLLGVTGSGKTYTMANVIARLGRPALVIAHNKTLAAQLAGEFKEFFPDNFVGYFVSYYDYYQPEAYIPSSDTYIEKDTLLNDEIDKLRHSATCALFERRDVIIVASVSCIYGLGSPTDYSQLVLSLRTGMQRSRDEILRKLVAIQYRRNDVDLRRGTFRVRGDTIEISPVGQPERGLRIELFGDEVERLREIDVLTGRVLAERDHIMVYPANHYVTRPERMRRAITSIEEELEERLRVLESEGKLVERQRLEQRTRYDLEMLEEMGFCPGIENYSRHLTGRAPGDPPYTLLDFFPSEFLTIIDESHQTVPQVGAMYSGDRSRKETLVDYGFRLPSALDNRPLTFQEFEERVGQVVYVSATPGPYERNKADRVVEQIVRPTGLLDPEVVVRPVEGQVDDLMEEIRNAVDEGHRVLVTTLTKRMAEDLTDFLKEADIRVRYLHSEIDTLERMEIVRDLRLGEFDVLVGINLLREGLDLPEVALVAILDADKEGFLRSTTSLIQTIGRAARNVKGRVVMYADEITGAMRAALEETERRRSLQDEYNREHNITPATIRKAVREVLEATRAVDKTPEAWKDRSLSDVPRRQIPDMVKKLHREMKEAAQALEFERAALLRDMIHELESRLEGGLGSEVD